MRKKCRLFGIILATVVLLSGCGGKIMDSSNYNFSKNGVAFLDEDGNEVSKTVYVSKSKTAEVYIDGTLGMADIAVDSNFKKLLMDSVDAIEKTWGETDTKIYSVSTDKEEEKDISFINSMVPEVFNGSNNNAVEVAVAAQPNKSKSKIIIPKIKLIVTDLRQQLNNYQKLSDAIKKDVFDQKQSLALIELNTQVPFYIFAIGAEQDLSDYLDNFYQMPVVSEFNGFVDKLQHDMEHPINVMIFAYESGLMGIDYENVEAIESGEYTVAPEGMEPPAGDIPQGQPGQQVPQGQPGQPMPQEQQGQPMQQGQPGQPMQQGQPGQPMQQGQPGQPMQQGQPGQPMPQGQQGQPGGMERSVDEGGSFEILRPDYDEDYMRKEIEGTVNFALDTSLQGVNEDDPWIELGVPTDVSEDDVSVEDIKYLAFKSLMWDGSEEAERYKKTAGKIKINVPFKVMSQIKLSTLVYEISTDIYTANEGEKEFLGEANKRETDIFEIEWAEGTTPSMGKHRIDDMTNAAVLNIFVKDLNALPDISKLDIKFTAYPEEQLIPVWVTNHTNGLYPNLTRFVSQLNGYQAKTNKSESLLTCYICAGDKEMYENVKVETMSKLLKKSK